jgi:HupE / UreJ protein
VSTAVERRSRRGPPTRLPARAAALLLCVVAAGASLLLAPATAGAHPLSTTAILLDVGPDQVTGRVQLPIDRLAIAVDQPLTATVVDQPGKLEELRRYVTAHISGTDPTAGATWAVDVSDGRVETIDGVDHLVFDLALRPSSGNLRDFQLHYDAIVHRLVSHRIFVSSRAAGSEPYAAVGIIDWQSKTVTVPVGRGVATEQGFLAATRLGVEHIAEGADHLLFLVMLLLPAPLLARGGRWVRTDDLRRSCVRVVHVVTAFAVGHSVTLALAALGYLSVPTRIVESLIALSILVSAVHAIRPIVRGGEPWIAAGFGLMHGLAFAALLDQLDLSRSSLVTELLGFNLGIELTQLIVVALVMPSLMVLSHTLAYPTVRIALASLGVVLAAAWLAERTTLITSNPLVGISTAVVEHPIPVVAGLAGAAAATWAVPALRTRSPAMWTSP